MAVAIEPVGILAWCSRQTQLWQPTVHSLITSRSCKEVACCCLMLHSFSVAPHTWIQDLST